MHTTAATLVCGDQVDHLRDYLLAAFGVASNGSLVFSRCCGGLDCEGGYGQVVRRHMLITLERLFRRLRVKLKIYRLPPRRLRSALCRRQLVPAAG
jgi:hypothetical protein